MRQDEVNRRITDPTYCPACALCVSLRLHACALCVQAGSPAFASRSDRQFKRRRRTPRSAREHPKFDLVRGRRAGRRRNSTVPEHQHGMAEHVESLIGREIRDLLGADCRSHMLPHSQSHHPALHCSALQSLGKTAAAPAC